MSRSILLPLLVAAASAALAPAQLTSQGREALKKKKYSDWKPRTDEEQRRIIERGDRTIRTYSGTSGGLKVGGCQSNWKPGDYGYDPAKHACPDSASGGSEPAPAGVIAASAPPWKYRIEQARAAVAEVPPDQLEAALGRADDARIFALLERAYKAKVVLSEPTLESALRRSQEPRAAYAAAYQLAGHRSPTARRTIARHVARRAPGYRKVRTLLGSGEAVDAELAAAREAVEKRAEWMKDAATGAPGSRYQRRAIEALATEPGDDVTSLLQQLARDGDKDVAGPALAALEKRQEVGL